VRAKLRLFQVTEADMKTCLVVDDSDIVRKVARRILESLTLETSEAVDGQAALESCKASMPEAILLDCHTPAMSPTDFLTSLRALEDGGKPAVIYCAIENDNGDIARALTAGADDYVLKPFDRESLRVKLAACGVLPGA
jgi:two-component system chemotaxis response regulator CheY